MRVNIIGKLPPPIGGVTVHNERLYKWLKIRKVDVTFTSINKVDVKDDNVLHVDNIVKWMLRHLIRGFEFDIVHYQGANYYGLIYLAILRFIFRNKFKLLFTIHGEGYINRIKEKKILRLVLRSCFKHVDYMFCVGENIVNQIEFFKGNRNNVACVDPFLPPLNEDRKGLPHYINEVFESETQCYVLMPIMYTCYRQKVTFMAFI